MTCKNRVTDRRGLYTPDGKLLHAGTVRAAYAGTEADMDMVHLSVRDMIFSMCHACMNRIVREFDLDNGFWRSSRYGEAGRYADDILADWFRHGEDTLESLYDVVLGYIRAIRHTADHLPKRMLRDGDWMFTVRHGTAPKSIYPPADPPEYTRGEGHSIIPDGVTHPLIMHLSSSEPCPIKTGGRIEGAVPHRLAGCKRHAPFAPHEGELPTYESKLHQTDVEKTDAIQEMVAELEPQVAFLCENSVRQSARIR